MNIKTLSVKQPWAYAIMYLGKDIENRTRKTNMRGLIAIHSSKQIDYDAYYWLKSEGYKLPPLEMLETGKVLGTVELTNCVTEHASEWKEDGTFGYVLKNPQPFKVSFDAKGQLGFWSCKIPQEVSINNPLWFCGDISEEGREH